MLVYVITSGCAVIGAEMVDVMYTVNPLLELVYVTTDGLGGAKQLAMLM